MAAKKHFVFPTVIAGVLLAGLIVWTQVKADSVVVGPKSKSTEISGDPKMPRRHFRARDVAEMSAEERRSAYRKIRHQLRAGYATSAIAAAAQYQNWLKVNTAPYGSATHGQRFINNYVNDNAMAYKAYEKSGPLPVGAIIAKDSFVAATNGTISPGPLFVMEKMEKGFNYVSGDWRYTMIMPDGSIFGITKGANASRVEFCISCHLAREKYDHLFYVPEKYRLK